MIGEITYKIDSYGKLDENIVNWKMIKSNIEAPSEQQLNKDIIGIGNNGKSINMDLWKFSKLNDGTYILNTNLNVHNGGYLGEFTEDGKIESDIPVFISEDKGKTYNSVTSLENTFRDCEELVIAPNIPYGVTDLTNAFRGADIKDSPEIPITVTNLDNTFSSTKIEVAPYIPSSVENMTGTFSYCYFLTGNVVIDANPTEYFECFKKTGNITLSGKSTLLDKLLLTKQ